MDAVLWIAHQPERCTYSLPLRAFSSGWSKLPSLPAFLPTRLCSRSPSLSPPRHTGTWKFPGPQFLLCLTGQDLLCGRQRLGCVHGHSSTPRKAAAAAAASQNTAWSPEISSIVQQFFLLFLSLPKIAMLQGVWEAQFYLVKCVWNQMFSVV